MSAILDGFVEALYLIISLDPELWGIIALSLQVSGMATIYAALVGIPLGSFIALRCFPGKKIVTNFINTLMGFPPVVMGLILFLLLSNSGPLGSLGLLYTPTAMLIAQFSLALPIVIGTSKAAIESVSSNFKETVLSLGANEWQLWWELIKERKKSIIAGILVAFGQAISEVGAVMIVGGNIRWSTRTFTTSIVLETRMGDFGMAIALGLILVSLSFIINFFMTYLQEQD